MDRDTDRILIAGDAEDLLVLVPADDPALPQVADQARRQEHHGEDTAPPEPRR